jgi:hypothetical protein
MQAKTFAARWGAIALSLAACSSGQSGAPGGGQAGGISVDMPCSAEDCEAEARFTLDLQLNERLPRPPIVAAACVQVSNEPACQCSDDDFGHYLLGPAGDDCLVYGHGNTCLWQSSDVPDDCDGAACEAACDVLEERLAEDDRISYEYILRYSACVDSRCEGVAQIGELCHAVPEGLSPAHAQDCSLSNEAILQNARDAQAGGDRVSLCESSAECSHAYGCRNGICWSCNEDGQCAGDEQCVNGLCVLSSFVDCQSDDDCESPELCLLVGVEDVGAAPGRGNATLRAECAATD